jgi:hypothetical protein
MKYLLIVISCLGLLSFSFNQKACPTNLDNQEIKILEKNIQDYQGKVVAFDAIVTDIKVGNVNKPFYKVVLGEEHFWVGGHGQMGDVKIGGKYRILGHICLWTDDALNAKYNDKKYFILSLAHIDLETKMASVFPNAKVAFDEWTSGKIPVVPNK